MNSSSQISLAKYINLGQAIVCYIWKKYLKMSDVADGKKWSCQKNNRQKMFSKIIKKKYF